jgi:tRNA A-37 threonylcarbamoyl transferase component Bud32
MTGEPEHVGRYRIERVLGRGAMGIVYKAHDPEIDRLVAIKLVRADLLDGEERESYLVRFRREAQTAGRCIHPNIVAIYDFAMHEDHPFLVMEYVAGESLAQALRRGVRFGPAAACQIVLQVLEALACAHALGVVHRDVKPANILLVDGGRVKVTDFGVARFGDAMLTLGGVVVGTPSYMAPEQCRGEEVDHRSDLFSAGIVLFELLTGEKPFPGRTFTVIVKQLLEDEAPDLKGRVPDPLAAAVRRALAKAPQDRFPSAAAMAAALRQGMAAAGTAGDATILAPPRLPLPGTSPAERTAPQAPLDTGIGAMDEAVLTSLQRRLARHVGPIAKVLVGSAVRRAASVEALCELLAERIDSPEERREFLREAQRECRAAGTQTRAPPAAAGSMSGTGSAPPPTAIAPAAVAHATAELTRVIGPIARVRVQRALSFCATAAELWAALAEHIEPPAERAAFLRRQPRE